MDFAPFGGGDGRGGFFAENDKRAAEGHASGEQAGKETGEIFEGARGDFFGAGEGEVEGGGGSGGGRRGGFGGSRGGGAPPLVRSARFNGRRPRAATWRKAS
ncbi:hypothetical protein LBMAG56_45410 [Verrucomicrobiota bacterium]|nr:hypothetical protein LBMAG56_45410 [Verrucomicrobiota bacterium]